MKLTFTKKELLNIPNILCYIRLLCVPAFAIAFFLLQGVAGIDPYSYLYVSLAIFAFASLTDVFDGKIARRFHMESAVGAALDPLADKLLQVVAVVCLTVNGNVYFVFPILIGLRELSQIIVCSFLVNKNIVGKANYWGKAAALVVAIGIVLSTIGGGQEFMYVGAFQKALTTAPGFVFGGVIASWTGMEIIGYLVYWFAFAFLVVGTVLGYIAMFNYGRMVIQQLGGLKNVKNAENVRIDFFNNDSAACESREEQKAKEAEEGAQAVVDAATAETDAE